MTYHRTRREALIKAVEAHHDGVRPNRWIVMEDAEGYVCIAVGPIFVEFKPSMLDELEDDVDAVAYLEGCFE